MRSVESPLVRTGTITHHDERFVETNGVRLCYDTFGDPAHPAIVLIMGLAAQMILWDDDFCEALARGGHFVVRFDNRDIGRSSPRPEWRDPSPAEVMLAATSRLFLRPVYALADMAADVVGLLDALGIARAHVVGASMGGAIAQELAIRHRGRLRSITSIMSSTGDPKLPRADRKTLAVLFKPAPKDRAQYLERYVETWRLLSGSTFAFDPAHTREQGGRSYERGVNPPGPRRQLLAIIASGDRTAALHGTTTPALILHGSADPLVPVEGGHATLRAIPGATLGIYEGMGHTLPRELRPAIAERILVHVHEADAAAS